MLRIIFTTILFTLALGEPPLLKTCESSIGHVVNASVIGCKLKHGKYILKRGKSAGIKINFDTEKEVHEVKAFAQAKLNGLEMSYPLPNLDGCKVLKCPLQKGGPYLYTVTLPVHKLYPSIEVDAKLQLRDENEAVIACVLIPVKIK